MGAGELKIDARRKKILELLSQNGKVIISQLSSDLNATTVTIRNDLDAMERDGLLERIPGGAVAKNKSFYQPGYENLLQVNSDCKQKIAAETAKIIQDGNTLFLNAGTTTYYVAAALKQHKNLNIVTNSLSVAMELGQTPSFRVILLGGEINARYGFLCGGDAQQQLAKYKADYAILSLDGVSAKGGITTYHADEAIITQMMVEQAKELIVVADHSKMGHEGFSLICDFKSVDILVTDKQADKQTIEDAHDAGIKVYLA